MKDNCRGQMVIAVMLSWSICSYAFSKKMTIGVLFGEECSPAYNVGQQAGGKEAEIIAMIEALYEPGGRQISGNTRSCSYRRQERRTSGCVRKIPSRAYLLVEH